MVATVLGLLCSCGTITFDGYNNYRSRPWKFVDSHRRSRVVLCGSFKEESRTSSAFVPSELQIPLASETSSSLSVEAGTPLKNEFKKSPSAAAAGASPVSPSKVNVKPSDPVSKAFEKTPVAQFVVYGGLASGGIYLLDSLLNSFERFLLLPELMQIIGVLYGILLSSQLIRGEQLNFTQSPVKGISMLLAQRESAVSVADGELPEEFNARVVAMIGQLRRERDDALSKIEELKKKVADYASVVAEKEALEVVAVQLAQERDEAIREVTALKKAVDEMSVQMQRIKETTLQELDPLKQNSRALEEVALQLASERDAALQTLQDLKEELARMKSKEVDDIGSS